VVTWWVPALEKVARRTLALERLHGAFSAVSDFVQFQEDQSYVPCKLDNKLYGAELIMETSVEFIGCDMLCSDTMPLCAVFISTNAVIDAPIPKVIGQIMLKTMKGRA
jgi:hypothetical protein